MRFYSVMRKLLSEAEDVSTHVPEEHWAAVSQDPAASPAQLKHIHDTMQKQMQDLDTANLEARINARKGIATNSNQIDTTAMNERHRGIKDKLAANPSTPFPILWKLGSQGHKIFENPALAMHSFEDPTYTSAPESAASINDIVNTINKSHHIPLEFQSNLAMHPDPWIRRFVAQHQNMDPKVYSHLANDESDDVQVSVAQNPRTPHPALQHLLKTAVAKDLNGGDGSERQIIKGVIRNPNFVDDKAMMDLIDSHGHMANSGQLDVFSPIAAKSSLSDRLVKKIAEHPLVSPEFATQLTDKDSASNVGLNHVLDNYERHAGSDPYMYDLGNWYHLLSNVREHPNADQATIDRAKNIYKNIKNKIYSSSL